MCGLEMMAPFFLVVAWCLSSREAILQVCSTGKNDMAWGVGGMFIKEMKGSFSLYTQFTCSLVKLVGVKEI